ncbi:MAG TPA: hypothetical protein DDW52_26085, partial [Planctomycetaceae bacterium]|nr:hypothetical protein [Planctomycetaceae bacterium]
MHRAPNHIQRQAAGLSDRRAKVSLGAVVALISLVVCVAAGVWYTNRGTTSKQSTAPEAKSSDSASDPATESKSGDPETDDTTPPGSALAEQPAEDRSVGEPNQSEQSVADAGNVNAEDSARESLEQEIMAGKWTTQRLLVLCSSRPYLLDFHTSLNGVSLEESEQLQLSDLAAELMAGPEIVPGQEVDDSPNMMTGSDAPSEEQDDAQDGDLPASNDSESPLSEDNVGEIEDLATGAPGSDAAPPAREDEDDRQMEWSELLDLPLVRSSWLGNLVAEDDSTDQ